MRAWATVGSPPFIPTTGRARSPNGGGRSGRGACSSAEPAAHLAIGWKVTGHADALDITWKEGGMRVSARRLKRGFGMEVLEDTMAYELKAETRIGFESDGLRCVMMLPRENVWLTT
jgi:hypothetical protein